MGDFLQKYLAEILTAFSITSIAGFSGWFWERKRKGVEVKNLQTEGNKAEADYGKAIMDMYQEALTDLKLRYEERLKDLKDKYEERYIFLKNEYDLKFENLNLQMEKLKKDQEMWRNKYNSLKKEFDAYKMNHK